MRSWLYVIMSQMLANHSSTIFQDFAIKREKKPMESSAAGLRCHDCGRGLEHGNTLTAKNFNSKTEFFCDIHF